MYDDLFEDEEAENKSSKPKPVDLHTDVFENQEQEPLDEILTLIHQFTKKAIPFSQLLTKTSAVDHEIDKGVLDFFLIADDKFDQKTLEKERKYYAMIQAKFEAIIPPMRDLGDIHLKTIKQFNQDIDADYYSSEKTDHQIQSEKKWLLTISIRNERFWQMLL